METMEIQEAQTAEELINETMSQGGSPEFLLRQLEERAQELEIQEKQKVDSYIRGIRDSVQGVMVDELENGVGGMYKRSGITIATATLEVHQSIEQTLSRAEETWKHETYHQEHDHLGVFEVGDSATGATVVTVGGITFTDEQLIEGLTVAKTGNAFVSDDYKQKEQNLFAGIASAALTLDDVEEAVDKKDLTLIDDVSLGKAEPAPGSVAAAKEPQHALGV